MGERAQRKEKIKNMILEIVKMKYNLFCIYVDNSWLDAIIQEQKKEEESVIAFFSEDKKNPIDQKYIENIRKILIFNRDVRGTKKDLEKTLENIEQGEKVFFELNKQEAEKDIALFNELISLCS